MAMHQRIVGAAVATLADVARLRREQRRVGRVRPKQ
jgi:hypothetical protein